MYKLSPCPFCGENDQEIVSIVPEDFAVECNGCCSRGGISSTVNDAVFNWNTRRDGICAGEFRHGPHILRGSSPVRERNNKQTWCGEKWNGDCAYLNIEHAIDAGTDGERNTACDACVAQLLAAIGRHTVKDEDITAMCKMCGKETLEPTKMDGDCLYCPSCVSNRAEMLRLDLDVIYEVIRDRLGIERMQEIKDAVDDHYQAISGRLPGRCRDCNEPSGKLTCDLCGGEVIESTT